MQRHPFFNHASSGLRVRFRHARHDWLNMRLGWSSDRTHLPDDVESFEQRQRRCAAPWLSEVSLQVTSVYCPFQDMIAWLEAIALGCRECAWRWYHEGPSGRIGYSEDYYAHGSLNVAWDGFRKAPAFGWEIGVDKRQVVGAFYQAFRGFVESPEYRPLSYEQMRLGDELAQRSGFTEEELIGQILVVDRASGERHLQRIRAHGWLFVDDIDDPDTRFAATVTALNADQEGVTPLRRPTLHTFDYLHPLWNRWDRRRRRAYLREIFSQQLEFGWWGGNLRALRSTIVENYLGWRREPRQERYVAPPRTPLPDWYARFDAGSDANEPAQN